MKSSPAGASETTLRCELMPPCLADRGRQSIPRWGFARTGRISEPGQPRGLLPGTTRTGGIKVGAYLRKIAEAEAGLVEHIKGRPVVAIHQREIRAQHPFVIGEMMLDDFDCRGQRLLAPRDRSFIGRPARQFYCDPIVRHFG